MKSCSLERFYQRSHQQRIHYPLDCQFELTYRCNLKCGHCYCRGLDSKTEELSFLEIKKILDIIRGAGCIWLCLTGGEPLVRKDFLKIYSYAKRKGFLILIFTNGQLFNQRIIKYLSQSPPYLIELTLNGITPETYEKITRVNGSFAKVMANIRLLVENKLPLVIKTNILKQNKGELAKIKAWVEKTLPRPKKGRYNFKYDPLIYPRLNGNKTPLKYRVPVRELSGALSQDKDIWVQYQKELHRSFPGHSRQKDYLYRCDSLLSQFYINPFGWVKFCPFSEEFSFNLKDNSFKEGFYKIIPKALDEKFQSNSKCRKCRLRVVCAWCPAKAFLETGNKEKPVPYYCALAKKIAGQTYRARREFKIG